jgi:hypothetical protein
MLFVAWILAMAYSFTRTALMSARLHEVVSEAQEATVLGVDLLARDLRSAGYSASGGTILAVRAATAERVEVASDLNGDGDTADANELTAYSYDAGKRQLMRASGGASPQPLVNDVPVGGVTFAYFDAAGLSLAGGGGAVAAGNRALIRRIDARLRVEMANPDPTVHQPLVSTTTVSVALRNP